MDVDVMDQERVLVLSISGQFGASPFWCHQVIVIAGPEPSQRINQTSPTAIINMNMDNAVSVFDRKQHASLYAFCVGPRFIAFARS